MWRELHRYVESCSANYHYLLLAPLKVFGIIGPIEVSGLLSNPFTITSRKKKRYLAFAVFFNLFHTAALTNFKDLDAGVKLCSFCPGRFFQLESYWQNLKSSRQLCSSCSCLGSIWFWSMLTKEGTEWKDMVTSMESIISSLIFMKLWTLLITSIIICV